MSCDRYWAFYVHLTLSNPLYPQNKYDGKDYYHPHCTDEEVSFGTMKELVQFWWRAELLNMLILPCCAVLFCSFHIIFSFVDKRIYANIPFILFCGKEYVQRQYLAPHFIIECVFKTQQSEVCLFSFRFTTIDVFYNLCFQIELTFQ